MSPPSQTSTVADTNRYIKSLFSAESLSYAFALFILYKIAMAYIWYFTWFAIGGIMTFFLLAKATAFFGELVFGSFIFSSGCMLFIKGILKQIYGDQVPAVVTKVLPFANAKETGEDLEKMKEIYRGVFESLQKEQKTDDKPVKATPVPPPSKTEIPGNMMYGIAINGKNTELRGSTWLHLKHTPSGTHEMRTVLEIIQNPRLERYETKGWTVVETYDHDVCDYSHYDCNFHHPEVKLENREEHKSCCSRCTAKPLPCPVNVTATPETPKPSASTAPKVMSFDDLYRQVPSTVVATATVEEKNQKHYVMTAKYSTMKARKNQSRPTMMKSSLQLPTPKVRF